MIKCPSKEELSTYIAGACDAEIARRIENHLSDCSRCIERCISIDHDDELLSDVCQALNDEASSKVSSAAATSPSEAVEDVEAQVEGFQIQKELGRGGMDVVYLAEQLSTKRLVALKVLIQGSFASKVAKKRFEREVELAALLDHPNIVTVLESGLTSGRFYFAMKYVEGFELDLFVSTHTLNVAQKLGLLSPKTTASGRGPEEVQPFRCIDRAHRLSFREGPLGQEGEPHARLEKSVPCTMGMQVSRGDRTEVSPQGILQQDAKQDRPTSARPVPAARR